MAYLGRLGATAPLTSADIPDNSITAAKIVDATIAAGDLASDVVISTSGAITTTGAFTSVGIDDNADANAITIDANENVGIGTTTPSPYFECKVPTAHDESTDYHFKFENTQSGQSVRCAGVFIKAGGNLNTVGALKVQDHDGTDRFYVGGTGRVGIGTTDPGNLFTVRDSANSADVFSVSDGANRLVNIVGGASYAFQLNGANGGAITFCNRSGNGQHILFYKDGNSGGGNITQTGASVAFNASSDYRMKENIVSLDNALDRLVQLKPSRFNFIGEEETRDGFIAHEVSSLVPEAVTGEKDATEDRINIVLNSDGTVCRENVSEEDWTAGKDSGEYASNTTWEATKNLPSYQSIDQAKLVPLVVGAIKELSAKVTALENA